MKRTPLKRKSRLRYRSTKTQAREEEAKPERRLMVHEGGNRCWICNTTPTRRKYPIRDLNNICVHEIANGPHRLKALDKRHSTLILCWNCNQNVVTGWKETRQLALLMSVRPEWYDLAAHNNLVNPNAPRRIEQHEVDAELPTIWQR